MQAFFCQPHDVLSFCTLVALKKGVSMLLLHEAKPLVLMDLRTFYHCSRAAASKLCGKGFTFQVSYYFNGLTEAQYTSSSTETKEKRVEKSGNNIILFFFFFLVDQIVRKMRSCHSIRKLFWPFYHLISFLFFPFFAL